ncbi:DUF5667 domain-containing protein [Bacillus pseudomycoides]|uniref:DUF5667 domain-containing protein n=1 Tax=Bacillus pseudomycoides TaxID=64104 RepID=UPI0005350825|nr:DUF5667 domain-containing protein [Bacillus pseudomycoides]
MKKTLLKGTMVTMMACSPFLMGTAAYASENTDAVKTTETEKTSLVQGDVFYFVKTMVEDIKMALATNDLEKAKLLSEQAAERITEASVLIEKGKGDLTQDTLEKAVEDLKKADKLSGEEKAETEKPAGEEEKEAAKVKVHIGNNIEALAKVLDQVKKSESKSCNYQKYREEFFKDCS